MCATDAERSVEMNVTECEFEIVSALREIRDKEVSQMIGELIHVLSISHVAKVIEVRRSSSGLTLAGGTEASLSEIRREAAPIDLDLVDA